MFVRLVLVVLPLVSLACLCWCPVANAQLSEVQVDFGLVTEAALTRGDQKVLVLKNETDGAVIVDSVTAGCGCVQVAWGGSVRLDPGESFETTARLDPDAVRQGAFAYALVAEIDGVQQQVGEVRFEYDPRISPSQRTIWLQSINGLKRLETTFAVLTGRETDFGEVEVIVPPYITAEVSRTDRSSGSVTLRYAGTQPLRERQFHVLLKDPASDDAPVRMTVRVPALDLVAPAPGAVLFTSVPLGESATRSVRLRPLTEQALVAGRLEAVSPDEQVRGELREEEGVLWLDVTVRPTAAGVASTTITLGDRERTWSLPISVTWRTDG